ncbi:MAG: hypothetical protein ACP5LW_02690 [Nitrososphaeria archaeon]
MYKLSMIKLPLYIVSALPVFYAWRASGFRRTDVFIAALMFVMLAQLVMNVQMDLKDMKRGLECRESEPFLSVGPCYAKALKGTRALVEISYIAMAVAALYVLAATRNPALVLYGLAAILLMVAYLRKPLELYVRGLGEISTFFDFGPILVLGSLSAFGALPNLRAVLASIGFGLAASSIRYSHHLPEDHEGSRRRRLYPAAHAAMIILSAFMLLNPMTVMIALLPATAVSLYAVRGRLRAWADIIYLLLFFILSLL